MYDFLHSFDLSVFGFLHGLAGQSGWVDGVIVFLGEYLAYVAVLAMLVAAFRAYRAGKLSEVLVYATAAVSGLLARVVVAGGIRYFYHRPRPFAALNLPHLLTETSYAFPSGHAIFFFALAAGVFATNKRLGTWLYVAAILIGIGRIAAGVHYPSDILGGAVLGIFIGYVGVWVYRTYLSSKFVS
ncbi:MAG: phosphatase PAP2 family protein [bacterium]